VGGGLAKEKIMRVIPRHSGRMKMQKMIGGIALTVVLMTGVALAAHADDQHGHAARGRGHYDRGRSAGGDREWRDHESRARRDWRGHPEPGVIYAPPIVYPPPEEYQQPGFNLIVPLRIH
jgi:hypothetical protein